MDRTSSRPRLVVGAGVLLLAAAVLFWIWRSRDADAVASPPPPDLSLVTAPTRPSTPPDPSVPRVRVPVPSPTMPALDRDELTAVAEAARAAGKRPGEAAFRRMIDTFMAHNAEFARAQAAKERITVDEVAELTYLGYMVMATQSADEIGELTGRTYDQAQREAIGAVMQTHNAAFKDALRDLVARGAPEEARWELIRATEEGYKRELFAVTGLDEDLFDAILAGDVTRAGAPIATEYPDPVVPQPYVEPAPRPDQKR